ncbi:MAG: hypothetical protein ACFE9M_05675 [Promethearchaeota archaeon]
MAKKGKSKDSKPVVVKKTKIKTIDEKIEKRKKPKPTSKKEEETKTEYLSKEHLKLDIPVVPDAPKKSEKITLYASNLSKDVLERIKKIESPDVKVVLVNCERCKAIIPVPVPKNAVLDSELPVVPISYVHKNLQKKDQHCLTIHLDHDFDIRRQRISDVVVSSD